MVFIFPLDVTMGLFMVEAYERWGLHQVRAAASLLSGTLMIPVAILVLWRVADAILAFGLPLYPTSA